jgi:hypothetical protein
MTPTRKIKRNNYCPVNTCLLLVALFSLVIGDLSRRTAFDSISCFKCSANLDRAFRRCVGPLTGIVDPAMIFGFQNRLTTFSLNKCFYKLKAKVMLDAYPMEVLNLKRFQFQTTGHQID